MAFQRIKGPHPDHETKRRQKAFRKRQAQLMRTLLEDWRRLVKETVWESPNPSPDALIIARLRNQITMDIGWIHYPSGVKGGERRLQLRLDLFRDKYLTPERLRKLMEGL
jgi:hypothetical protein